jgi:hypothetical protein
VLTKLSKWVLVFAMALTIGIHWPILQSVAWVSMAISYSQGTSVKEGLAKTLDGKHPCKLCRLVQEGKKSERKSDAPSVDTKLDLFCRANQPLIWAAPQQQAPSRFRASILARYEQPPVPPPRHLLG